MWYNYIWVTRVFTWCFILTYTSFNSQVDVIVNTTSPDLDITKGAVCNSILHAAGDNLKTELDKLPVIYSKGGQVMRVKFGKIVETTGYRLKCRSIFHGSLYKWTGEGKAAFDVSMNWRFYLDISKQQEIFQVQHIWKHVLNYMH